MKKYLLIVICAALLLTCGCAKRPTEPEASAVPTDTISASPAASPEPEPSDTVNAAASLPAPAVTPEPVDMTREEYYNYCLGLLHGGEADRINADSLSDAAMVCFSFFDNRVTVYEDIIYTSEGSMGERYICEMAASAFVPAPELMNAGSRLAAWYSSPDMHPELSINYRGWLGDDWAMLVSEPAAGSDMAVFICTDDGWNSTRFVEVDIGRKKSCAGRCGEALFYGLDHSEPVDSWETELLYRIPTSGGGGQAADIPYPQSDTPLIFEPLPPVFEGDKGIMPVHVHSPYGDIDTVLYYFTNDGGYTWASD